LTYDVGHILMKWVYRWPVTSQVGDCLPTGKPSRYVTNRPCQLSLLPFMVGMSSTGLHGWG